MGPSFTAALRVSNSAVGGDGAYTKMVGVFEGVGLDEVVAEQGDVLHLAVDSERSQ